MELQAVASILFWFAGFAVLAAICYVIIWLQMRKLPKTPATPAASGGGVSQGSESALRFDRTLSQPIASPPPPAAPAAHNPATNSIPVSQGTANFRMAFAQLVRAIHVMIVGPTNAGKSTWARAVMAGRVHLGDQVIILDPHADSETWGGVQAIGTGRDFDAIAAVMHELRDEMKRRYERRAAKDTDYPPLTIFIDEWPAIQTHCGKLSGEFMTALAQEGRKVLMRLVLLTQSDRVESLGIAGKGDVRENFTWLLLGAKATTAVPELEGAAYPAAIRSSYDTPPQAVDSDGLLGWTEYPIQDHNLWKMPAPTEDDDAVLSRLFQTVDAMAGASTPLPEPEQPRNTPPEQGAGTGPEQGESEARIAAIHALVDAGWSTNRIAQALGGNRQRLYMIAREYQASKEATA